MLIYTDFTDFTQIYSNFTTLRKFYTEFTFWDGLILHSDDKLITISEKKYTECKVYEKKWGGTISERDDENYFRTGRRSGNLYLRHEYDERFHEAPAGQPGLYQPDDHLPEPVDWHFGGRRVHCHYSVFVSLGGHSSNPGQIWAYWLEQRCVCALWPEYRHLQSPRSWPLLAPAATPSAPPLST